MERAGINYRKIGAIARIDLDRPPVNAITPALLKALLDALGQAAVDDEVRVVLLGSSVAGRFSAGLDLPDILTRTQEEVREVLRDLYINLYDAQYNLGKPSIALVNGTARGGGMTLAISCDVLLAADDATFGYPEIDLGLPPAIHFAHLPRITGRYRAFELLFTGRSFGSDEARELGLVSEIVSAARLDAVAEKLARTFISKPKAGMSLARAAFMRQNDLDYRRSIAVAVEDFCNAFNSAEARDRLADFVAAKAAARENRRASE